MSFSECRGMGREGYKKKDVAAENLYYYILPAPKIAGNVSVEQALAGRRSRRNFRNRALSAEQLSQILWAAYGITQPSSDASLRGGRRTVPSAGALFPLEIYVVIGNVTGIKPGVYKYISEKHKIVRIIDRDVRAELAATAMRQNMVRTAPVTVVHAAAFERVVNRYGARGRERYVFMEIGHSSQNIYLQAKALGLGTVAVGAFDDEILATLLGLPANQKPFYLMPIGYYGN